MKGKELVYKMIKERKELEKRQLLFINGYKSLRTSDIQFDFFKLYELYLLADNFLEDISNVKTTSVLTEEIKNEIINDLKFLTSNIPIGTGLTYLENKVSNGKLLKIENRIRIKLIEIKLQL